MVISKLIFLKKTQPEKGFTFLEVMVALSVLAIIITSVFRLYLQSVSMLISTDFDLTAPLLAKKVLSELVLDNDKMFNRSGSFEDSFKEFSWESKEIEVDLAKYGDLVSADMKDVSFSKIEVVITNTDKRKYKTYFYADKKDE